MTDSPCWRPCTIKGSAKVESHTYVIAPIKPTSALDNPRRKNCSKSPGLRISSGGEKGLEKFLRG